ncbi:LuxR C-terminal-related transcriptional regulator [Streptomyces cupreus]|uniref:AAA family ATPase n=1 Tax=Streptomyces cupreus TaxID=2759956 RepID=A0A7X1JE09_9ACTN|nr:LuxR C-terminal-related transcriptional regulator [Streptomyces cupreus]MBC2906432.1 AAA family ATPase [Streptomyces cupreus]
MVTAEPSRPVTAAAGVDPLGAPYLPGRFAIPARPPTFLRRRRLHRHLDVGRTTPLTMVNGAAGAGKTLLVADWAASLDEPVVWLTSDAGQTPGLFWAYLLEALHHHGVLEPAEVGFPADAHRVDRKLLARLAVALAARERPVVVVLDEYDRVTDPAVSEQVEFVLRHAGRGLHLLLVTRTEPLLPLHRHRAAGTLTEIRNAELAFTPEETVGLLALHGLELSVAAAAALVERTGGWAAGLRLCALAAREADDPEAYLKEFEAGQSTVADYLLGEVLKRQPAETQDLLLRVSVLDRFSPVLANTLTGRLDAEPILDGLRRQNAFVESLGHSWYRLHPLFGEILRSQLEVTRPGLRPLLHRRAARWLRRSGYLPEALAHGAAAGDWEFTAAALVDDLAIGQLFTGLRAEGLADLFSGMAPETTSPAAELVRAARALNHHDLGRGLAHLHHAERTLAAEASDPAAAQLSCALLEAHAARLTGAPGRAEKAARSARHLQGEVPAQLLEQHPELNALLLTHLGTTHLWAGRFQDARAALDAVVASPAGAATALPRQASLSHLALIDYLDGWLDRAERKALAALTETERYGLPPSSGSSVGHLVRAAVAVERDELDEAQSLLDEAAVSAPAGPDDPVTAAGRALTTARLRLAQGDAPAALSAAEPAITADVVSPWERGQAAAIACSAHLAEGRPETAARALLGAPDDQAACAVEAARALLAVGHPGPAIEMLDAVPPEGEAGPAVTVPALLVRAQACDQAGDPATARRILTRALLDARRERLRRPFLEARPWVLRLLATDPQDGLAEGWLLRGALPTTAGPLVVEELSARERDVLARLAQMMSTEEIAADLYVSVNTVKTHLKGIFRKLAVNRRTDAVRRARELGLL